MHRGCIASAVPKSVQFSTPSGPSLQAHNHRKYKGLWLKKQLAAEHGHTFTLLQDLLGCGVVVRQGVAGIAVLHRKTGQPVSRPERHQHSHCEASQECGKHFSSPTTATNTLSRLFPYLLPSSTPEGTCNLPGWHNLRVFLRCQTSPTPRSVLAVGQLLLRTWPLYLFFHTGLPILWRKPPHTFCCFCWQAHCCPLVITKPCYPTEHGDCSTAPSLGGRFFTQEHPHAVEHSAMSTKHQSYNTSPPCHTCTCATLLLPDLRCARWGFHFSVSTLLPREIQENQIWQ